MKAAVFHRPGKIQVDTVDGPRIEDVSDVILKVTSTAICGSVYDSLYDYFLIHRLYDKGITIRQGQAPVHKYIDQLIGLVAGGKVVLDDIISHTLPLSAAAHAYDIFHKKED